MHTRNLIRSNNSRIFFECLNNVDLWCVIRCLHKERDEKLIGLSICLTAMMISMYFCVSRRRQEQVTGHRIINIIIIIGVRRMKWLHIYRYGTARLCWQAMCIKRYEMKCLFKVILKKPMGKIFFTVLIIKKKDNNTRTGLTCLFYPNRIILLKPKIKW